MLLRHNKKRNIGLVYEFFSRYVGQAILENRDGDVAKARTLLCKHYNKTTDLYKEYKLFKVLYETRLTNKDSALQLINKVRDAVKLQSQSRLDMEKSSLIHEINLHLGDDKFFNRSVQDYKTYASIQMLLNSWRSLDLHENIGEAAQLEERLVEHLTRKTELKPSLEHADSMSTEDVDRLVVHMMTQKVNEKFGTALNEEQKKLIQLYVFSDGQTSAELTALLESIKQRSMHSVTVGSSVEFVKDKVMVNKLDEVYGLLVNEYSDTTSPTDDLIGFYLGLSTLQKEMSSNE